MIDVLEEKLLPFRAFSYVAHRNLKSLRQNVNTHTQRLKYKCSLARTNTVVTAHESHTTKHRSGLEREILVGCQEQHRKEAKLTVH